MATDVNPNAEPIQLQKQDGLDPNQHNPLNDGNFIERQANKLWHKSMKLNSVTGAIINGALLGSMDILGFIGTKFIQHLIGRFDVNPFKLFTDPLGFFGGSAFKSTRYFHYYTQFSLEKNEFMSDPIATYSASAVATGSDIGSYIVSSIQQGQGNNLKRYYQYSTLRFKNRYWNWRLDKAKDVDRSILRINNGLLSATTAMPKRFEIVYQDNKFVEYGISYLSWIKDTYGLDEFHREYNGKQYDVLQPPVKQDNGQWAIAQTEDEELLLVPTIPVKPSKGLIWWTNSEAPKNLEINRDYITEVLRKDNIPANYPNDKADIGKLTWVDEAYYWTNPNDKVDSKESDNDKSEEGKLDLSGGLLYSKFVTLTDIKELIEYDRRGRIKSKYNEYYYTVTIVVSYIGYDTENFIYVEEDGTTNNPAVAELFKEVPKKENVVPVIASNTSRAFKFYPYIPLREWTSGRHAYYYDFPRVPYKFTQAIRTLNNLATKGDIEDEEAYAYRNGRKIDKTKRKDSRKKAYGKSAKAIQRSVARGLASKRKVTLFPLQRPAVQMNAKTMKRHVNQMAKLLNVDFDYESANFTASDYYNRSVYDGGHYVSHLLMPAVNFASNNVETHRYLYCFFNRLYNMFGREEQVKNWYATIQNATSLNDITVNKLEWVNQSSMDWGGMSWLFINKFKMQGNIRKLKRKHGYYDICRGKPVTIGSIQDLQKIGEPLHELADDKHWKTKNGIEYCIGGQGYNGNGIHDNGNSVYECFRNFDYTFIAKQSGKNEISVLAIAGLSFTTKLSEQGRWCRAFHDLGLHYERNKQMYRDKNRNPNSTDEIYRKESKKHYHYNVISHWGIIPLDYRSLCRMGGIELERFAQRSLLHYGFVKSEQKGKRKGLKPFMVVVQVVLFIVGLIFAPVSGGSSVAAAYSAGQLTAQLVAQAIAQAIVIAVVSHLAINKLIIPLLKALGIKGLIAMIVLLIAVIVASMLGGQPANTQSALPYASEVGKNTAIQVSKEVVQKSVVNTLTQNFNSFVKSLSETTFKDIINSFSNGIMEGIASLGNTSLGSLANQGLQASFKALNQVQQEQFAEIQSQAEQENELYKNAMEQLDELQENIRATNYDIKAVLEAQRTRFRMYDPETFLASNVIPDTYSTSFDYLSNFINMKLNVDPATADVGMTPDFSFNSMI